MATEVLAYHFNLQWELEDHRTKLRQATSRLGAMFSNAPVRKNRHRKTDHHRQGKVIQGVSAGLTESDTILGLAATRLSCVLNSFPFQSTMMQLGFVSAILPDLSLEQIFGVAERIGYRYVEVMCWPPSKADRRYAGVTHIDVSNLDATSISTIQVLAQNAGVQISGLGYYPNCLAPDAEEAER